MFDWHMQAFAEKLPATAQAGSRPGPQVHAIHRFLV